MSAQPDRAAAVAKILSALSDEVDDARIVELVWQRFPDLTQDEFQRGLAIRIERVDARIEELKANCRDLRVTGMLLGVRNIP